LILVNRVCSKDLLNLFLLCILYMQEFKENNNNEIIPIDVVLENQKFNDSFDESLRSCGYEVNRSKTSFKMDTKSINLDTRYIYTKKYNIDFTHPEAIRIQREIEQFPIQIQCCFYKKIKEACNAYDEQVKKIDKLNELSMALGNNRKKNKKIKKLAEKLNM
jgi:hypothetical protein